MSCAADRLRITQWARSVKSSRDSAGECARSHRAPTTGRERRPAKCRQRRGRDSPRRRREREEGTTTLPTPGSVGMPTDADSFTITDPARPCAASAAFSARHASGYLTRATSARQRGQRCAQRSPFATSRGQPVTICYPSAISADPRPGCGWFRR
jgi:hypothetical protein